MNELRFYLEIQRLQSVITTLAEQQAQMASLIYDLSKALSRDDIEPPVRAMLDGLVKSVKK